MRAASLGPMSKYDVVASVYQTKGVPIETMCIYMWIRSGMS